MIGTYSACSGDVFTDIRSWDNDFGLADIVVLKKHNLQEVTNLLILIDNSSNSIHKVNDLFGLWFRRGQS